MSVTIEQYRAFLEQELPDQTDIDSCITAIEELSKQINKTIVKLSLDELAELKKKLWDEDEYDTHEAVSQLINLQILRLLEKEAEKPLTELSFYEIEDLKQRLEDENDNLYKLCKLDSGWFLEYRLNELASQNRYFTFINHQLKDETQTNLYIDLIGQLEKETDWSLLTESFGRLGKLHDRLSEDGDLHGFNQKNNSNPLSAVSWLIAAKELKALLDTTSGFINHHRPSYFNAILTLEDKLQQPVFELNLEELARLHQRLCPEGDLHNLNQQFQYREQPHSAVRKLLDIRAIQKLDRCTNKPIYSRDDTSDARLNLRFTELKNLYLRLQAGGDLYDFDRVNSQYQSAAILEIIRIERYKSFIRYECEVSSSPSTAATFEAIRLKTFCSVFDLGLDELSKLQQQFRKDGDLYDFNRTFDGINRPSVVIKRLIDFREKVGYFENELATKAPDNAVAPPGLMPAQLEEKKATETTCRSYSLNDIVGDGCFLSKVTLENMKNKWKEKQNLILQGPPGTGKTWLAKKLAFALMGKENTNALTVVQFHPNLSYEDFIRGWRPTTTGTGSGNLDLVNGPFMQAVNQARQSSDSNKHVVVIEEINRGNPAQIFGEMLTLLESTKRIPEEAMRLSYGNERVYIPDNLYVVGTMNIADRSLALVDLALRRRFAFFDLKPVFDQQGDDEGVTRWKNWVHEKAGIETDFLEKIARKIADLNNTIAQDATLGPQFKVGHSYLTPSGKVSDPKGWYRQIVESEIAPLLHEYWFDDAKKANAAKDTLLEGI